MSINYDYIKGNAYYDKTTGTTYTLASIFDTGIVLARSSSDGFYYELSDSDLENMFEVPAQTSEVVRMLEDKEQGRLKHLTREKQKGEI